MKRWKKCTSLLLALVMCLGLAACGGKVSIEDLEGFWYPPEGLGTTTSVVTCIYIDGTEGTWVEYNEYGDQTEYSGLAYTDGKVLTLTSIPWIGDVEIPIGDENTLVTDTGETYWIKGTPDFRPKYNVDSSGEYDYSAFLGTWTGDFATTFVVEKSDDGQVRFEMIGADGSSVSPGYLQYSEESNCVYAYYDQFDEASVCQISEDGTLTLDYFFSYVKVSDDAPGATVGDEDRVASLNGTWHLYSDADSVTDIEILDGAWSLWEQDGEGMWSLSDSGSISAGEDGWYEAVSDYSGGTFSAYLYNDDVTLLWDSSYFERETN